MAQIWNLFTAHLREGFQSRRVQVITLAVPLLIVVSTLLNVERYEERVAEYQQRVSAQDTLVAEEGELNRLYDMTPAEIPPAPLSAFIEGVPPRPTQRSYNITIFSTASFHDSPYTTFFPSLDLGSLVMVLLSLVALFVAHDAVSGERENGTLRLILSNPVPRWKVITAKWLAGLAIILPGFVIGVLLAVALALVSGSVALTGGDFTALLFLLLAGVLYISAFYGIGLAVSSLSRRSATAILVSFALWITLVLVLPNVGPYLAGVARELPVVTKVEREILTIMDTEREGAIGEEVTRVMQESTARLEPHLAEAGLSAGEFRSMARDEQSALVERISATNPAFGRLWQQERTAVADTIREVDREYRRRADQKIEELYGQVRHQSRLASALTVPLPSTAFLFTAVELAGVGMEDLGHVRTLRRQYRNEVLDYIFDKVVTVDHPNPWMVHLDLDDRPRFAYRPRDIGDRLRDTAGRFLVLVLWNLAAFAVALLAFLRYDVR